MIPCWASTKWTGPTPCSKRLVETLHNAGWCVYGKNGSDVTSYAITAARIHTGKRVILWARGSYHGWHFWCQEHGQGIPEAWQSHIAHFEYNDVEDLERVVEENRDDLAAAMATQDEIEASDAIGRVRVLGETLIRGLQDAANSDGVEVTFSARLPCPSLL